MIANKNRCHFLVDNGKFEFYSFDGLPEVHIEMMRLLKIIDKVAKVNNIPYWIDGGSLIGAARHKGFIPWDDDLDISLLKKDYLKLLSCLDNYCAEHEDVALFYEYPYETHTCNFFSSTRVYTRAYGSYTLVPVKVDIRPLNCIKTTKETLESNNRFRDIANVFLFGKSYGYTNDTDIATIESKDFFKWYNNDYGVEDPNSFECFLTHPYFEFSNKFELHIKDVFPISRLVFEGFEVPVPAGYANILNKLYGNYMELPSLDNRAPVSCKIYHLSMTKKEFNNYVTDVFGHKYKGRKAYFKCLIHGIVNIGFFNVLRIKLYES